MLKTPRQNHFLLLPRFDSVLRFISSIRASLDWASENSQKDMSFEDMMASFKQSSDARMLDIKRNTESKRGNRRK